MRERMSASARRVIGGLIVKLERDHEPAFADLTEAGTLKGWCVQRQRRTSHVLYDVWKPDERNPAVPWAVSPDPPRQLTRSELVAFLREHWVPAARAALFGTARDGTPAPDESAAGSVTGSLSSLPEKRDPEIRFLAS